jgi:hypothetical protein
MTITGIDGPAAFYTPSATRTEAEEIVERTMKRLDTNRDGNLGVDELGKMQPLFARADADGNGLVSREELLDKLSERLAQMDGKGGGLFSLDELKSRLTALAAQDSETETQTYSTADVIQHFLTKLGLTSEEGAMVVQVMQRNGLDVSA